MRQWTVHLCGTINCQRFAWDAEREWRASGHYRERGWCRRRNTDTDACSYGNTYSYTHTCAYGDTYSYRDANGNSTRTGGRTLQANS